MTKRLKATHRDEMRLRYARFHAVAVTSLGGKCGKCGATRGLQFDHIDRSTKVQAIAKMWSWAKAKVDKELAKCQLLCERCHRAKTSADLPPLAHGTPGMYERRKCRCEICRVFYAAYRKSFPSRQ